MLHCLEAIVAILRSTNSPLELLIAFILLDGRVQRDETNLSWTVKGQTSKSEISSPPCRCMIIPLYTSLRHPLPLFRLVCRSSMSMEHSPDLQNALQQVQLLHSSIKTAPSSHFTFRAPVIDRQSSRWVSEPVRGVIKFEENVINLKGRIEAVSSH